MSYIGRQLFYELIYLVDYLQSWNLRGWYIATATTHLYSFMSLLTIASIMVGIANQYYDTEHWHYCQDVTMNDFRFATDTSPCTKMFYLANFYTTTAQIEKQSWKANKNTYLEKDN